MWNSKVITLGIKEQSRKKRGKKVLNLTRLGLDPRTLSVLKSEPVKDT